MPNKRRKSRRPPQRTGVRSWRQADPPSLTLNPWNYCVVRNEQVTDETAVTYFTMDALSTLLEDQLKLKPDNTYNMTFRLRKIGVWAIGDTGALTLNCMDLDAPNDIDTENPQRHVIATRTDSPGKNHWAHVHFVWPRDNRNNVNSSADGKRVAFAITTEAKTKIVVYFALQWRVGVDERPQPPSGSKVRVFRDGRFEDIDGDEDDVFYRQFYNLD